jgi:hypothetical protein
MNNGTRANLPRLYDGSIDWATYYREGTSQEDKWDTIQSLEADDAMLDMGTMIKYSTNLSRRKKEKLVALESYSPDEPNGTKRGSKKESKTKSKDSDVPLKKIMHTKSDVEKELEEHPYLKRHIIDKTNPYSHSNSAQMINVRGWYSVYGKLVTRECANTYEADRIASIKPWNFGSLEASILEAVPEALFKLKGTEITKISTRGLEHKGKHLIRRGALTGILRKWCYVVGIRYIDNKNRDTPTGIKYWALEIENTLGGIDFYLTGKHAVLMLKDLLFLIRDKSKTKLEDYAKKGRISHQLYNLIEAKAIDGDKTIEDIITDMKNRLYYDCTIYDDNGEPSMMWQFPKINIHYLNWVIRELSNSNRYFNDVYIPLIKNTYLFPIKCSDTRVHPMSNEQHKKNREDYEIGQYYEEPRGAGN